MPLSTVPVSGTASVDPFHIDISQAMIDDLRHRLLETRWPSRELVADRSPGVQLETLQALVH